LHRFFVILVSRKKTPTLNIFRRRHTLTSDTRLIESG
jgi:hypothetical protein